MTAATMPKPARKALGKGIESLIPPPERRLMMVPWEQLAPAEDNVRAEVGDVDELAASIDSLGLIHPLLVSDLGDYAVLIAGDHVLDTPSRRVAAGTVLWWLADGQQWRLESQLDPATMLTMAHATGTDLAQGFRRDPTGGTSFWADERTRLLRVLEANRWNRQRAAAALGISRVTLWRRMERHHIRDPLHPVAETA